MSNLAIISTGRGKNIKRTLVFNSTLVPVKAKRVSQVARVLDEAIRSNAPFEVTFKKEDGTTKTIVARGHKTADVDGTVTILDMNIEVGATTHSNGSNSPFTKLITRNVIKVVTALNAIELVK